MDNRAQAVAPDAGVRVVSALVYVLDCDHGTKVGITIQTIEQRIDDLARGSGLTGIRVVRTWECPNRGAAHEIEQAAQRLLAETCTVGEWFHCHPIEACSVIDDLVAHGIPLEGRVGVEEAARIRAHIETRRLAA